MATRYRTAAYLLLGLGLSAGIVYYLYINSEDYIHLLRFSASGLLTILALTIATPFINGQLNVVMFAALGAKMPFREGFYLAASATLANQLPLPGGIISRGVYLKKRHGLPYARYISATVALFFCTVAANGFIGIGILGLWSVFKGYRVPTPLIVAFMFMAACVLVFWAPIARKWVPGRIGTWVHQAMNGWGVIGHNPALLLQLVGLQTGLMLLFAVRLWLAFQMLSQDFTFGQAILLSSGSVLTQLISFLPGGLGAREAIVGAIATALGFDLSVSIAAVELDRVLASFTIVVVGLIGTIMLGKTIKLRIPRRKRGL